MGEIVGFSRLEILEEKEKKKKPKSISSSAGRWKKSYEKNGIYTGLRKTLQDREVILFEIPLLFKMDEYFFLFLFFSANFFFSFFLLTSPNIFLVENKRTDIDGTQHRGEIHASLMEMSVSVTSVCSFEKLNRATIVEGSGVLTSTAIKISKKKSRTKVVQFPPRKENARNNIFHDLKVS